VHVRATVTLPGATVTLPGRHHREQDLAESDQQGRPGDPGVVGSEPRRPCGQRRCYGALNA